MKLDNPGYRVNQRLYKGTICGSFEWKIRSQLSQAYCYDTGILTFLSIVIVTIRNAGTQKVTTTIRTEKPPWCATYCYNTEETKGREISVSQMKTDTTDR